MADLLTIPPKSRARDLFERLTPEVAALQTQVEARGRVLEDIRKTQKESREAEQALAASRQLLYSLFDEKLRCSEAEAGDEIALFISSTLEELTADKIKPKGGK